MSWEYSLSCTNQDTGKASRLNAADLLISPLCRKPAKNMKIKIEKRTQDACPVMHATVIVSVLVRCKKRNKVKSGKSRYRFNFRGHSIIIRIVWSNFTGSRRVHRSERVGRSRRRGGRSIMVVIIRCNAGSKGVVARRRMIMIVSRRWNAGAAG
jgi:hypothetical protein